MRLLILCSLMTFVLAEDLLFTKQDPNLVRSTVYEGRYYRHAFTVKTVQPYLIAVYIDGNGVRAEATVTVSDPNEAHGLKMADHIHTVMARLPMRKFAVMCQEEEPRVMYVVDKGTCTKKTYMAADPSKLERQQVLDQTACSKLMNVIKKLDPYESEYEEEEIKKQAVKDYRAQMLYFKPPNPKLHKWTLWYGGLYNFGNVLDTATTPPTLGLYIRGNGVEDELYVRLDSLEDIKKVKVVNGPKIITVDVQEKDFKIICKRDKPGLVVIKNGVCKRRTYDAVNQAAKPKEDPVDGPECQNLIKEVETTKIIMHSEIWYEDTGIERAERSKSKFGGTFTTASIVNMEVTPPVLGMYIDGNGLIDEIHVKLDNYYEVKNLLTLNTDDRVIFWLRSKDIAVIAKSNSYGLVVIEKGECKRRIYDEDNPYIKPNEEMVLSEQCKEYIGEVNAYFLTYPDIWYLKYVSQQRDGKYLYRRFTGPKEHGFEIYWIWNYVEKKPNMAFTIGLYIVSEFLEDEFHLDSKSEEDALKVETKVFGDYYIVTMKPNKFALLARHDMPWKLIVVQKGTCTRRIYKQINGRLKNEAFIPTAKCEEIMKEVGY